MEITKEAQIFWHIIEADLIPIPCHIKNTFHLNGYSNALSFKHVGKNEIDSIENFVKNELDDILNERCIKHNLTFNEADRKYFFGIYETDPKRFTFKDGDIVLILEVADHVRKKLIEIGIQHFQIKSRRKIWFQHSSELSIGLFFARKENTLAVKIAQSGVCSLNEQDIKDNLFHKKVKVLLESASEQLKLIRPIDINIITVTKKENDVHAEVQCVFCSENNHTITIQCNPSSNSNVLYWNLSNFKKHIVLHKHKCSEETNNNKPDDPDDSFLNNSVINDDGNSPITDLRMMAIKALEEEEKEADHSGNRARKPRRLSFRSKLEPKEKRKKMHSKKSITSTKANQSSLNGANELFDILLKQMSDQNLKNFENTLNSADKLVDVVSFSLDENNYTIKVVKIDPNGSCLFGTITHQLSGYEVNSNVHKEATSDLRKRTVAHIQTNFGNFVRDLQGRLEEQTNCKLSGNDVEKECRIFLNACLPLPSCFGGYECIKAISEIEQINVITISEQGECYMAVDFNPDFMRTIFLSHRLASSVQSSTHTKIHNSNRNHYDSVFEIERDVLFKIAELLAEREKKKAEHKNNTNNITLD